MNLQTILDAARALGPVLGAVPAVIETINAAVSLLSTDDQETAKAELAKLREGNDELHERLQAKLGEAATR